MSNEIDSNSDLHLDKLESGSHSCASLLNARYTERYTAKDQLKDGTAVIVRAIRSTDKELLQQIMRDVSAESRYFRFFSAKNRLTDKELQYFTEIDFDSHIALIVSLCDQANTPIAVGRFIKGCTPDLGASGAELALLVNENYQRQGLGSILLNHLANIAVTKGVSEFVCYIMTDNSKMLNFLRHSKYAISQRHEVSSVYRLSVDLMHKSGAA
jgi:GNAT superfamily N-acetyltransferase